LIALGVIMIGAGILFTVMYNMINKGLEDLLEETCVMPDLSLIEDGVYEGHYDAFPIEVTLYVTIEDHVITQIQITEHNSGRGGPAEVIVDDVISNQSLDVDLISGASYSSQVILLAIKDALS